MYGCLVESSESVRLTSESPASAIETLLRAVSCAALFIITINSTLSHLYPNTSTIHKMFAARQVSQSIVGAVQRRAFSASASNVSELNPNNNVHWKHPRRVR
jgi:hypothetical protein